MIGEIDIYGVFFPPLLVWMAVAFLITVALTRLAAGRGLFRLVWHRPLFELAAFVIVLGTLVIVSVFWMEP
ncbi:DUF1656 domain-containing protein [Rhodopila globiformis]|uniref:DUF1656 domain-containing protein n=1 Tax=Rhodopila globiformis TaxID=1071 RepID=A0A2S6N641_RHOGL|nr:DUF1656 domain-containing protein [Rhodopila globiformis]PPQ30086.1 hypothetical protein CCS01_20225 [Rhodopila globiformis]